MKPATVSSGLAFLIMCAVFSPGQTPSGAETGIEGVITISPTQPGPVRDDAPGSGPLANATFVVKKEKDTVAAEFTTDGQGHFRTSLPPGRYKVSLKGKKGGPGRFGPFDVEVVTGKITKVQWECDSGIR
jgi:Carboxypeptidase regulatory-like domain